MSTLIHSIRVKQFLAFAIPILLLAAPRPTIAQKTERREPFLCLSTDLVLLTVTVTDARGHPVTDLTRHDFIVTDRKKPQQIEFFSREDGPRGVGIVLSRSMANTGAARISALRHSVLRFQEQSNDKNEYFIITAGGGSQLVTDWTRDKDVLVDGLDRAESADGENVSAFYDSCVFALEKLEQRGSHTPVIILITDGKDMSSRLSYTDLRETLNRSNALVYSICLADRTMLGTGVAQSDLKKLSTLSGGASYVVSSENELAVALERIATELHHQYLIGFYPGKIARDGSWHRVKVMSLSFSALDGLFNADPLVVRSRSGYKAPNEPMVSR